MNPIDRTLRQAFELWINPEINRRAGQGMLPEGFRLDVAQIIMNVGEAPVARLNEEIRARMKVRVSRDVTPETPVYLDDLAEITDLELTELDANTGHLTVVRSTGDRWQLLFDFRYNALRITDTLHAAREFMDTAAEALAKGRYRAFADNLFSTTELLAKTHLLSFADANLLHAKSPKYVRSTFNRWGKFVWVPVGCGG